MITTPPAHPRAEFGSAAGVFRGLRIIHLAMVVAVLICGTLVVLARSLGVAPPEGFLGHFPGLRIVVWLVAAGCFLAIQRVRERFLTSEALRQRARPVSQSIVTWHVIMFALAEAIAVCGLILFLLTGLLVDSLLLAGLALVLLYQLRPMAERLGDLLRQVEDR